MIRPGSTALRYMAGSAHRITSDRGGWLTLDNTLAMQALIHRPNTVCHILLNLTAGKYCLIQHKTPVSSL